MYRTALLTLLAAMPSSANYTLRAYDFGNGAGQGSSSSYRLQAAPGTQGGTLGSATYSLPAGIQASLTAPVPQAPTLSNPDSSYSRLQAILNTSGFATDTKYAIAISSDDFATTQYVQPDQTVGNSISSSCFQTYAAWGGASGFWVLGLTSATAYKIRVAAMQGSATASQFGPTASATTATPSASFALSTSLTASPPFAANFSNLLPGAVTAANAAIIADISTNALYGGAISVRGQNTGLTSASKAVTIPSNTTNLASASQGYGAQVNSAGQGSGGPLTSASPFNGVGGNVGIITTNWQTVGSFATPITSGSLTLALKAKADTAAPAAADYSDVLGIGFTPFF